jgi:hypothetical protein
MARRYAQNLADDVYPGHPSSLSSASAAIAHGTAAAADLGVEPGVLPALGALFGGAVRAGHGAEGYARLARHLLGPVARFRDSAPSPSP